MRTFDSSVFGSKICEKTWSNWIKVHVLWQELIYVTTVSNRKTIWHLANYRACLDHVIKIWVCHICSSCSLKGSLGGKTDDFVNINVFFFFTVFIGISMTEREKWEYAQNVVIRVCYSGAIIISVSKYCFWTNRGILEFCTYVKTNFQWKERVKRFFLRYIFYFMPCLFNENWVNLAFVNVLFMSIVYPVELYMWTQKSPLFYMDTASPGPQSSVGDQLNVWIQQVISQWNTPCGCFKNSLC